MRRIALFATAAATLACHSNFVERTPGPLDKFYFPTGIAILDHQLFVASSNADLLYNPADGGTVIAVNPDATPVTVAGALQIQSFSGDLGIADPAVCPALAPPAGRGAAALVATRGSNLVYRLDVSDTGAISCADCTTAVGTSDRGDPWAVGIACDTAATGIARAYVGYIRGSGNVGWITQIDLKRTPADPGYVQHAAYDFGQVRSFAYDAHRTRLYFTHAVTGGPATLDYVDLANECRIDVAYAAGGCKNGASRAGAIPTGLEIAGIALANDTGSPTTVRRAYLTAKIYDAAAAASAGGRVGDFDGLLLVVDLAEDAAGVLDVRIVDQIPLGYGATYVRVLPRRTGKRDVVTAIAADDGVVWIYDDETGERVAFGRNPATGAPLTGQGSFALGVDPVPLAGNVARVYVGSFREHFVTPIDVPLDDPGAATIPLAGGELRRISGGVLQ